MPETAHSGLSQSSVLSSGVGNQPSSNPSQGSEASGSLYCPGTSDLATQSSGGGSIQSQHQILTRGALRLCSTQSLSDHSLSTQVEQSPTSGSPRSSSHCSRQFIPRKTRSELLHQLRHPARHDKLPVSHNSSSSSLSTNPLQIGSTAKYSLGIIQFQDTHGYPACGETDFDPGKAKSSSCNSGTAIEIAETPPARLSLYHSESSSHSNPPHCHTTLSRVSIHRSPSQTSQFGKYFPRAGPIILLSLIQGLQYIKHLFASETLV